VWAPNEVSASTSVPLVGGAGWDTTCYPGSDVPTPTGSANLTVNPPSYSFGVNPSTVNPFVDTSATVTVTRSTAVRSAQGYVWGTDATGSNTGGTMASNSNTTSWALGPFQNLESTDNLVLTIFVHAPTGLVIGNPELTVLGDKKISDHGPCKESESCAGGPINLATGNVWIGKTCISSRHVWE